MFILDQSNKVLFNMLFYKIKKVDNKINIFNKQDELLGVLGEYEDQKVTQTVLDEIINLVKYCHMNKIFCVYEFPAAEVIKKMVGSG